MDVVVASLLTAKLLSDSAAMSKDETHFLTVACPLLPQSNALTIGRYILTLSMAKSRSEVARMLTEKGIATMTTFTRRDYLQGALAMMAAGVAPPASDTRTPLRHREEGNRSGIKLALVLGGDREARIKLAQQIGIRHLIVSVEGDLKKVGRDHYEETLAKIKADYNAAGMTIAGVESHPVPAEKIKLGLPGRDEEIENYCAAVEALGKIGVPMVCYNFMAGIGWYRTNTSVPTRGGALASEFDYPTSEKEGLTEWGKVSEDQIWRNLESFQKAVIPVAEKAHVQMALHPDDPPISPLRGIGRILTSAANYRRVLDIVPSPANGITFCQANFKLMGENIEALAREWCTQKKIFFVHFRDVEGTREHFVETFHDDGPTDMARMLRAYHESGFNGPMRPDHAPTMEGEANENPGYAIIGKLFAIGYIKGIMDGLNIPYA